MSYLELCPACLRLAKRLVDQALDFTEMLGEGNTPQVCDVHLQLVFSTLGYATMATWLDSMLARIDHETERSAIARCPLCIAEAEFEMSAEEKASPFRCPAHGGATPEVLQLIRRHLQRIGGGERFDQQRFVIRAALIFYAGVRGTSPIVRIE